jgi:hypothetical protein
MLDIHSQAKCPENSSEANSFQQIGLYAKVFAKREVDMEMIAKLQQLNSEILTGNKSAKSNLEQLLR